MPSPHRLRIPAAAVLLALTAVWSGCSYQESGPLTAPNLQQSRPSQADLSAAIAAQERHTPALRQIPGVLGTAVGLLPDGRPAVQIFLQMADTPGLPQALDGIPVQLKVTHLFMARSDPTLRARPAPLGYSVGHPDITAGTIGSRVINGSGSVFMLSNNHVLANSNDGFIGDPALQPGPYDGGTSSDQVGTLYAYKPIDFSGGDNSFDAAIALTTTVNVGNATPSDDGYGTPSSVIWGDANNDGLFDNKNALLNLRTQKFGRTTKLTKGTITGINGIVDVCYEVLFIFCIKSAHYVDQLIIGQPGYSGGGDSGSLIVTDDADKHPIALLFAGSDTETIANRIDLVLNYFGVTVDGAAAVPPTPLTDVAITGVSAPATVTVGNTANVVVTLQNVGNQNVAATFAVTLVDATDNVTIGIQTVAGLAAGASTTRSFGWNTTGSSLGAHTLTASHSLADDNAANNQASTTSTVNSPSLNIHVGDLDALPSNNGTTWSATVEITVHDAAHQPLNGATVVGSWSRTGLNSDTCTTGDLGGNGSCIVLFPSLKKSVKSVTFTVTGVTMAGKNYVSSANHDLDGSSNGTSIKVSRP